MAEKFKIQKKKKFNCNCICCKFCNEFWTEYKPTSYNTNNKQIKYRKKYYCQYNCYNCLKYIAKKKKQWEIYKSTTGIAIDTKRDQPKIEVKQINIEKDTKEEIIEKIKTLNKRDFQELETKKMETVCFIQY